MRPGIVNSLRFKGTARMGIFIFLLVLSSITKSKAWSEHPLLVKPALQQLDLWGKLKKVEAKSLENFLAENEKQLEVFLAEHELWSRTNLPGYKPCPAGLAFKATGNLNDIRRRFFHAIRINPHAKIPLYLHLLPGETCLSQPLAPVHITTLGNLGAMAQASYVLIYEKEEVSPLDVLVTASDEPDYGFDLGLFEDNNTAYGEVYGFGTQPYGNPNLEYSSQAPFHMGFYHEAKILYKFGPFLKQTYLDYRIFLYKALSEFAFRNKQPYWGWRFLGWGMHYVGDVSMPYHMKPLPGVSTARMLWLNTKGMLGFEKAKKDAIQIVSNRHTVFEEFQLQQMRKALLEGNNQHPFLVALREPGKVSIYNHDFLVNNAAFVSANSARMVDKAMKKSFPKRLVSDPAIEVNELPELHQLEITMLNENGEATVHNMVSVIADQLRLFSMHIRSYFETVLEHSGQYIDF